MRNNSNLDQVKFNAYAKFDQSPLGHDMFSWRNEKTITSFM